MATKHTIYFVRHGETDWNREGRLQGQQDIPLNTLGRAQARRNGEVLRDVVTDPDRFDFVSSPLGRARQTMEILREAMGLDPSAYHLDDRLRELTFGTWEGITMSELRDRNPEGYAARRADKWRFAPPGGESYEMATGRVRDWMDSLTADTIVTGHGGISRALRGLLFDMPKKDIPSLETPQDKVYVWRDGAGGWI